MAATFDDVMAARARLAGRLERTPTRRAPKLESLTGARRVWLKIDAFLHTGSFKERGALNALSCLSEDEAKAGVVTASAGNHAQALAHHAAKLGISAKIVMPEPTPFVKVQGTRKRQATVVLHGDVVDDAMEEARRIAEAEGRALIHPFDDERVIAGQGTALVELLEDADDVESVVCPVGGGGLLAGSLLSAEGVRGADAPSVFGVEPTMFPSLRNALRGDPQPVGGATVAEGVAVKRVGEAPLDVIRPRMGLERALIVSEAAIEEAVVHLAMREKIVAEGAGALGLAALLEHREAFEDRAVALLVCGGNIDPSLLGSVLSRHLVRARRRARLRVECPDRPGRLAEITAILTKAGANVIDVQHDRLAVDVPAKETMIDVVIETDTAQVTFDVLDTLHAKGFPNARLLEGKR